MHELSDLRKNITIEFDITRQFGAQIALDTIVGGIQSFFIKILVHVARIKLQQYVSLGRLRGSNTPQYWEQRQIVPPYPPLT